MCKISNLGYVSGVLWYLKKVYSVIQRHKRCLFSIAVPPLGYNPFQFKTYIKDTFNYLDFNTIQ